MATMNTGRLLITDDIADDDERGKRASVSRSYAASLARRLGSEIDLVHVDNLSPQLAPAYRSMMARYLARQKARLSRDCGKKEQACRALFLAGDPVKEIVGLGAKKGRYELITLNTHGRKGLGRILLGSVTEEVIRRSMTPVMTIGPKAQKASQSFLVGPSPTIFVPTGLTSNSDRAEKYAVSLAKRLGARIVFFHSVQEQLHPAMQAMIMDPGSAKQFQNLILELKDRALTLLRKKVKRLAGQGISASSQVDDRYSFAAQAVLSRADQVNASLIVMGTHGRSLLGGAFLGRTARDVILGSKVPVITVRSRST